MSEKWYGCDVGDETPSGVTVSASSPEAQFSLRVPEGIGITKVQLLKALKAMSDYITVHDAPV